VIDNQKKLKNCNFHSALLQKNVTPNFVFVFLKLPPLDLKCKLQSWVMKLLYLMTVLLKIMQKVLFFSKSSQFVLIIGLKQILKTT